MVLGAMSLVCSLPMRTILLGVLFLLPSCGTIGKIQDAVEKLQQIATKAELNVANVQDGLRGLEAAAATMGEKGQQIATTVAGVREVVASADKDKSGKISGLTEWHAILAGLLALLGVGLKTQDNKRSATAKELHEKTNALASKVAAIDASAARKT
jgi:hypothetical protein